MKWGEGSVCRYTLLSTSKMANIISNERVWSFIRSITFPHVRGTVGWCCRLVGRLVRSSGIISWKGGNYHTPTGAIVSFAKKHPEVYVFEINLCFVSSPAEKYRCGSILQAGFRIRIRSDPVFLAVPGSGSGFQIPQKPDPVSAPRSRTPDSDPRQKGCRKFSKSDL